MGGAKASAEIGLSPTDTLGAGASVSGLYGGAEVKIPVFGEEIAIGAEVSFASYGLSASIGTKTEFNVASFFGVSVYVEIQ